MLLRHWISLDNPMLTDCALATFHWIPNSQPSETFEAIGTILKTGRIVHYSAVFDLFATVYDSLPSQSIDQLHKWLIPVTDSDLCWFAGQLSLVCIQLNDAIEDEGTLKKVVDIVNTLWDDPRMPLHQEMQEQTTIVMEGWASEALDAMNKDSYAPSENYPTFFHELYRKCEGRRNRLEFYLLRWEKNRQRERERERLRASRGGEDSYAERDSQKFSYHHLLPQG